MISRVANNTTTFGSVSEISHGIARDLPLKEEFIKLQEIKSKALAGEYTYAGKKLTPGNAFMLPPLPSFLSKDGDILCINNGKTLNILPVIATANKDGSASLQILKGTNKGTEKQAVKQRAAFQELISIFDSLMSKKTAKRAKTPAAQAKK